jgi:hypothetical protein
MDTFYWDYNTISWYVNLYLNINMDTFYW